MFGVYLELGAWCLVLGVRPAFSENKKPDARRHPAVKRWK